jgi:polar amino acid transport system substrate-binding protein
MTTFLALAAAVLISGMAVGPAAAETYKVGIDQTNYEPFAWKDASGTWLGWEVELLYAVCESQGMTCELAPTAWDGIIPALQEKKIDFIFASMTINDDRKQQVDFSHWYYDSTVVLIGAKSNDTVIDFDNPESLAGMVLGAQGATIHSKFLEARFGSAAEIKTYDGLDNALADLAAGRVDYVQEGTSTLNTFLASPEGADFEVKATAPADPILGEGVGAAVRKGETALLDMLNAGIQAVIESGKYAEITAKYPQLEGLLLIPDYGS